MNSIGSWLKAFRLRTLPLSLSGILVGSFCALHDGFWKTSVFVLALSTTILFQILSNLANDLGDTLKGADNANRVGPERSVQSGSISKKAMRNAIILTATLSLISAAFLIYFGTQTLPSSYIYGYFILALACVAAAILYTMGKHAYGYLGLGDVFVFLFFGGVSVFGVYPLFAAEINCILVFPAITIGCLSTMVLNLNNMRDRVNDAVVGKRTLVVKIGYPKAKMYHTSLLILALICMAAYGVITQNYYLFVLFLPFLILFKHLAFVFKNTEERLLDSQLKTVALTTFLLSLLFGLAVGLEIWTK